MKIDREVWMRAAGVVLFLFASCNGQATDTEVIRETDYVGLERALLFDPTGAVLVEGAIWLSNPFGEIVVVSIGEGSASVRLVVESNTTPGLAAFDGQVVTLHISPPNPGGTVTFVDRVAHTVTKQIEVLDGRYLGLIGTDSAGVLLNDVSRGVVSIATDTGEGRVVAPFEGAELIAAAEGRFWFVDEFRSLWTAATGGETVLILDDSSISRVAAIAADDQDVFISTGTQVMALSLLSGDVRRSAEFVNIVGLAVCDDHVVAADVEAAQVVVMSRADLRTVDTFSVPAPRIALCDQQIAWIIAVDGSLGSIPLA